MSEWKERAIKRRDERHTLGEEKTPPSKRKKNRKRWCKGKVGVNHTAVWQALVPNILFGQDWNKNRREFVCTKCKKVLDTWWPGWGRFGYKGRKTPKPKIGSTNPDGS